MRLTFPLFLFKLPKGHLFRGKYRLVKPVTPKAVQLLKKDLAVEEQNMFYLRHPYLTLEQSVGHCKHLNKNETWFNIVKNRKEVKFTKHRLLKDELSHLKSNEQWEFTAGSL